MGNAWNAYMNYLSRMADELYEKEKGNDWRICSN